MASANSSPGRQFAGPTDPALTAPETAEAIAALLPRRLPVAIRVSRRLRGVSLRFLPDRGLEVATAPNVSAGWLVEAVSQRRDWLVRVCERLAAEGRLPGQRPVPRPDRLVLTAFGREWRVDYLPRPLPGCRLTQRGPGAVLVTGAVTEAAAVTDVLTAFCRDRAGPLLRQALAATSRQAGLPYTGVTIRAQRTRWGSCSAQGRINLNFTLAFLPWEFTRLVLLHELCHTLELNHSARFWAQLERHVPHCRSLDARLATAGHYLPLWLQRGITVVPT